MSKRAYVLVRRKKVVEVARPLQGHLKVYPVTDSFISPLVAVVWPGDGVWLTGLSFRKLLAWPSGTPKKVNVASKIRAIEKKWGGGFTRARTGSPGITGFQHRADAAASAQRNRAREAGELLSWMKGLREAVGGPIGKPKAVLIQENIPRIFDATALSNMKLVDVARALETVTAKQRPNPELIRQLLSRVLAGVSTAALGVLGRPEQLRLIRHLNRSLDRIVDHMGLGESLCESYYRDAAGLQDVIDRWQRDGDKLYDNVQPLMIPVADLWSFREFTWSRKDARVTAAEWDVLKGSMAAKGWERREPVWFQIGRKSGAKVGEGNHRLSLARELRIRLAPVRFAFQQGVVKKDSRARGPVAPTRPKVAKPVTPSGPVSAETEQRIQDILDLL